MKHLFRATKIGWEKEKDGVWFDSDAYSKEEAEAEFKPYQGTTQRGYPYTGYERDGQKYHDVTYLGEFEDDELPHSDTELLDAILKRKSKIQLCASIVLGMRGEIIHLSFAWLIDNKIVDYRP